MQYFSFPDTSSVVCLQIVHLPFFLNWLLFVTPILFSERNLASETKALKHFFANRRFQLSKFANRGIWFCVSAIFNLFRPVHIRIKSVTHDGK
jgi:hypothetical protein